MLYLLIYLGCTLIFLQGLRYAQHRNARMMPVIAVNYATAAVASVAYCLYDGAGTVSFDTNVIMIGIANGLLFLLSLFVLLASYRMAGVSITVAILNSSLIFPVVFAHLIWPDEEQMTIWRWIAIVLVPVTMFLIRPIQERRLQMTLKVNLTLLLLFVMAGMISVIHKIETKWLDTASQPDYQMYLFSTAALGAAIYTVVRREWPACQEISVGLVVGLGNALSVVMILGAITSIGAVMSLTLASPLTIILNLMISWWLWRERLTTCQSVGVVMAIAIVILTNMPTPNQ